MKHVALSVLAPAVLLSGCIPLALSPLYRDEQDLVSVEGLDGEWLLQEANDLPARWTFSREEGGPRYRLTIRGEATEDVPASAVTFRVAPVEVEGRRFLDFRLEDYEPQLNFWFAIQVLPVHAFARVELRDDSLQLTAADLEAVRKRLKTEPDATPHRMIEEQGGERVLLLGDTQELRRFVATLDDATCFSKDTLTFRRAVASAAAPPEVPAGQARPEPVSP